MTQDEIMEMGIKANLCDEYGTINWEYGYREEIIAFAKLVAAKEREACAKIVEESSLPDSYSEPCLLVIAEEIRARGNP